jgi:hypothetical protein
MNKLWERQPSHYANHITVTSYRFSPARTLPPPARASAATTNETIIGGNVLFEKNVGSTLIHENTIAGELQIIQNDVEGEFGNGSSMRSLVAGNMQLIKNSIHSQANWRRSP